MNHVNLNKEIILFDGDCNLCNNYMNLIIRYDQKDNFRFATIKSQIGQNIIKDFNLIKIQEDTILLIKKKSIYTKSDAVIRILSCLQFPINVLSLISLIPRFIRDYFYDIIAKNRKKFFKTKECLLPNKKNRERFL
ncbi:MAG: hypothetical protein CBC83_00860 [Flavobacteriales bacterium TMED123]|mgnify:CR=1 FL=1|nr:MAG: hypothetical protein CBC83_00860 [Flavobacteriales bacterium TMED123]|tara:strand:- start:388 stop:795 length:408 start_codon:yes stop_codon:yes gene_type:complete